MVKRKTATATAVLNEWLPGWFIGCEEAGEGDYGEMLRWRFVVPSDDGSELWVRSVLTSDKWSKSAKAWKLYAGLTGEAFADDVAVNTDALLGAPLELMWQLNREDKPTISLLRPAKGTKLKPAVVKALNADEDARWNDEEGKDGPF